MKRTKILRRLYARRKNWRVVLAVVLLLFATGTYLARRFRHVPVPPPSVLPVPPPEPPGPPGIILHHSETPAIYHGTPFNAARLEGIHADDHPGWATVWEGKTYHIGYHYVILPDGTTEKGRPDLCPGTHARKFNNWIGVCVVGEFQRSERKKWWPTRPTEKQVKAIVALCEDLMVKYHIPAERVLRHQDVNYTNCPGKRFPYARIQKELKAFVVLHPETKPLDPTPVPIEKPPLPHSHR